ncbi:MAG: N-acetyl-gamma-glutamyl-phosphate reductase [Chloroflexi bacterium]|nr:MAG: N-acetyl-gamma-glutamyl-phosphate reductase [Chloroflexota bacterium]
MTPLRTLLARRHEHCRRRRLRRALNSRGRAPRTHGEPVAENLRSSGACRARPGQVERRLLHNYPVSRIIWLAKQAAGWLRDGRTVIDIGSDFRLRDPMLYERWYGYAHPAPDLLREAVYGLTELTRDRVRTARLIANPGCYPTAALLALAPALKAGLVTEDIVVDAKSGVTGAGHSVEDAYLFGTIDESVRPYGVPKHRHTPEIAQEAAALLGKTPRLTFTPHLIPMNRGLIASCYAPLRPGKSARDVAGAYAREYAEEPFVRVLDTYPATKATLGSNWCLVHALVDEENARLVAFAALDNLVKGAAGSALQNFNARFGYPETMGLEALPLWP